MEPSQSRNRPPRRGAYLLPSLFTVAKSPGTWKTGSRTSITETSHRVVCSASLAPVCPNLALRFQCYHPRRVHSIPRLFAVLVGYITYSRMTQVSIPMWPQVQPLSARLRLFKIQ